MVFEWGPGPKILTTSLNYLPDSTQSLGISDRDASLAPYACSRCHFCPNLGITHSFANKLDLMNICHLRHRVKGVRKRHHWLSG